MSVFWLTTSTSGRLHLVRCRTCMASTVVSSLREVGAWQRAHDVLVCVDTVRAQRRTRGTQEARGGPLGWKWSPSPPAPTAARRTPYSAWETDDE